MRSLLVLLAALLPLAAQAFSPTGLYFSHHDWELACDNTGTCRAAGYQPDGANDRAVSVLLRRGAGPEQPVSAQVMLGQYEDSPFLAALPARFKLALKINGQPLGTVEFAKDSLLAELSEKQAGALLNALARRADIRFSLGSAASWQLSDRGAAAVLLKFDEYQGRTGTTGALIQKGRKPESNVPAGLPLPKFKAGPVASARPGDEGFASKHAAALRTALRASMGPDECQRLEEDDQISASRLTPTKMLVTASCWLAPSTQGSGYWVVNDAPPFEPVLVTTDATDAEQGRVYANHKQGGMGDCRSAQTWSWDGRQFRLTEQETRGMCKMMAIGGPWSLQTIVTDER